MVCYFYQSQVCLRKYFRVNADELYYDLLPEYYAFNDGEEKYSPFTMYNCTNTWVIDNIFNDYKSVKRTSGIYYNVTNGFNCLSGNVFINYAIRAYHANISSCLRPKLIECINGSDLNCFHAMYDNLDENMVNKIGLFIINNISTSYPLILANHSKIALDNINIISEKQNIIILGNNSDIFLADLSMTANQDISYDEESCEIIENDRILYNPQYVAKLRINCAYYNISAPIKLSQTMQSSQTKLVNQSNPIYINLITNTSTYYPGQILYFKVEILDILEQIIPYHSITNTFQPLTLQLNVGSFSTGDIHIKQGIDCPICKAGYVQLQLFQLMKTLPILYYQ